jgi:hypothetical protein
MSVVLPSLPPNRRVPNPVLLAELRSGGSTDCLLISALAAAMPVGVARSPGFWPGS